MSEPISHSYAATAPRPGRWPLTNACSSFWTGPCGIHALAFCILGFRAPVELRDWDLACPPPLPQPSISIIACGITWKICARKLDPVRAAEDIRWMGVRGHYRGMNQIHWNGEGWTDGRIDRGMEWLVDWLMDQHMDGWMDKQSLDILGFAASYLTCVQFLNSLMMQPTTEHVRLI